MRAMCGSPRFVKFAMMLYAVGCLTLSVRVASAGTVNMPVIGGGTLFMTETSSTFLCSNGARHLLIKYTNFSYSLDTVTNPTLIATVDPDDFPCRLNSTYTLKLQSGCTILLDPYISVAELNCPQLSESVGPEDVVVGASDAPPGPSGFVQDSPSIDSFSPVPR